MNTSTKYELSNGTVYWFSNGKRHRTDGPAVITKDGIQHWYLNGKHHRADGPAVIYPDGTMLWYFYGVLHRTDGPAVVVCDGQVEYWIEDIQYDPIKFLMKSYEYTNQT